MDGMVEGGRVRTWLVRALGSSPLVRPSDRLEAVLIVAAVLLSLIALPFAATAGMTVYRNEADAVRLESLSRQRVVATLTEDSSPRIGYPSLGTAPVKWSLNGGPHTAFVSVDHPLDAGSQVQVWVDEAGNAAIPPRGLTDARLAGVVAAAELWSIVTVVLAAVVLLVRRVLTRRRHDDWDREHRRLVAG